MRIVLLLISLVIIATNAVSQSANRKSFNNDWQFHLGDLPGGELPAFRSSDWRKLDLPHDWSIELAFDKNSPAGIGGGALNGGVGWYRKSFSVAAADKGKVTRIGFDGVYCNSEVWVNGHYVGKRPNGYVSFTYDISKYLHYGSDNLIAVKVDNSQQPNSRWYSGSGIYRNVWITVTGGLFFETYGTHVRLPSFDKQKASFEVSVYLANQLSSSSSASVVHEVIDAKGKVVATSTSRFSMKPKVDIALSIILSIPNATRWSVDHPYLYKLVTTLVVNGKVAEKYFTSVGLRNFSFDEEKGFFLNGRSLKIRGVCQHHDLGCLGTAVNRSALRRQLELLKAMGCNAIRTSHNMPAPELLDLCDEMGFLVMNEAFDMWAKQKSKYDYSQVWKQWWQGDLTEFVIRDRNHPSVIMWSLGNEIPEQWSDAADSSGIFTLRNLTDVTQRLDPDRPTLTANNEIGRGNKLLASFIDNITGFNYNHLKWDSATLMWPGRPFIVTESVSALQTRGHYDFPADSMRIWPPRWDLPVENANGDHTCSAFDNCRTPWGSTHEASLIESEKYDHVSGMFVWTGFDYLGEPTPYGWPSRSSYFGIIDLAGFPKDVYYLYQSAWTTKPVLHIFPHWNWQPGKLVDVVVYYNEADHVELYLDNVSLGKRSKPDTALHVTWKVPYKPGTLKAISRKNGRTILTRTITTAGAATTVHGQAYAPEISSAKNDLAFVSFSIIDNHGNVVPGADNELIFDVKGGKIAGVDNGYQASLEPFVANQRKAYNGLCLAVVRPDAGAKEILITATSPGLKEATVRVQVK